LLGVTWLLGFFIEFHTAIAYLFILLNSTQGIVFTIFHCLFDEQVREGLRNKLGTKHKVTIKTKKSSPAKNTGTAVVITDIGVSKPHPPAIEIKAGEATVDLSPTRNDDDSSCDTKL